MLYKVWGALSVSVPAVDVPSDWNAHTAHRSYCGAILCRLWRAQMDYLPRLLHCRPRWFSSMFLCEHSYVHRCSFLEYDPTPTGFGAPCLGENPLSFWQLAWVLASLVWVRRCCSRNWPIVASVARSPLCTSPPLLVETASSPGLIILQHSILLRCLPWRL